MAADRQEKVARMLQRELSEIFQRHGAEYISGVMIDVTMVRITPDLGLAKVYLSLFPVDKPQEALETIINYTSSIRGQLGYRVGNSMRQVPELRFYIDDSMDYAERIDELLK